MPDRIAEIRARLDAVTRPEWSTAADWTLVAQDGETQPSDYMATVRGPALYAHAPADIAWLLDEVERLLARGANLVDYLAFEGVDVEPFA